MNYLFKQFINRDHLVEADCSNTNGNYIYSDFKTCYLHASLNYRFIAGYKCR